MGVVRAFLNRMLDPEEEPLSGDTVVQSFRLLLLFHLAAGHVLRLLFLEEPPARTLWLGALFLLGLHRRFRRLACGLALPLQIYHVGVTFPAVANHLWIETLLLFVLTLLDDGDEDAVVFRQFARWVSFIVLFYAGFQKLWYGTYFDGQYLALSIGVAEHYRKVFSLILPAEEIARLVGLIPVQDGSGPFRVPSLLFVLVSNSVWIGEIVAAVLLLFRRTRTIGLISSILVIAGIEVVAREVFFGLLFTCMLLTFVRTDVIRRMIPVAMVVYAYPILSYFGIVPRITFFQ